MSETQELKACWCCNAPALLERDGDHHGEWFNLGCSRHWEAVPDRAEACPAGRIWYTADPDELEAAITAWNTRPREAELEAEVGRLREALEYVVNPLAYLRRQAEARGRELNGWAYSTVFDLSFVQSIAEDALSHPKGADDGC